MNTRATPLPKLSRINLIAMTLSASFVLPALAADTYTPGQPVQAKFKDLALPFLEQHCFDCHDNDTQKGDLNLSELTAVDETNAATWKSVWAQIALKSEAPC
jgi:hypothetical protein